MKSPLLRTKLVNLALFQAGWFACVLGAASGRVWLGTGLGLFFVFTHLALVVDRGREGRLLAIALIIGLVVDSVHVATDALVFVSGSVFPGLAPPLDSCLVDADRLHPALFPELANWTLCGCRDSGRVLWSSGLCGGGSPWCGSVWPGHCHGHGTDWDWLGLCLAVAPLCGPKG